MSSGPRTRTDAFNWLFLLLSIVLAGIHLYLAILTFSDPDEPTFQFTVIGFAFLIGPVLYFTPYWQTVLYLLWAGFAVFLGVVWVFGGMDYPTVGVATGVVATVFILLALYLFVRAQRRREPVQG